MSSKEGLELLEELIKLGDLPDLYCFNRQQKGEIASFGEVFDVNTSDYFYLLIKHIDLVMANYKRLNKKSEITDLFDKNGGHIDIPLLEKLTGISESAIRNRLPKSVKKYRLPFCDKVFLAIPENELYDKIKPDLMEIGSEEDLQLLEELILEGNFPNYENGRGNSLNGLYYDNKSFSVSLSDYLCLVLKNVDQIIDYYKSKGFKKRITALFDENKGHVDRTLLVKLTGISWTTAFDNLPEKPIVLRYRFEKTGRRGPPKTYFTMPRTEIHKRIENGSLKVKIVPKHRLA